MDEISIFDSKEATNEIKTIDLGISDAGKNNKKTIFVKNNIEYPISATFSVNDNDVNIAKQHRKIPSFEMIQVTFDITPSIKRMKPIKAELKTEISYVVQ